MMEKATDFLLCMYRSVARMHMCVCMCVGVPASVCESMWKPKVGDESLAASRLTWTILILTTGAGQFFLGIHGSASRALGLQEATMLCLAFMCMPRIQILIHA